MTRDEILNMPASREMDVLIADRVLGLRLDWEFAEFQNGEPATPTLRDKYDEIGIVPFYSTDANDMLSVSDNLKSRGFNARIEIQNGVRVTIWKTNMTEYGPEPINAKADSIPLAICRAALLCVME